MLRTPGVVLLKSRYVKCELCDKIDYLLSLKKAEFHRVIVFFWENIMRIYSLENVCNHRFIFWGVRKNTQIEYIGINIFTYLLVPDTICYRLL